MVKKKKTRGGLKEIFILSRRNEKEYGDKKCIYKH